MQVILLVGVLAMALSGCGKTLDQTRQTIHAAVDIGFKAIEDGTDAYNSIKKVVLPATTPPDSK